MQNVLIDYLIEKMRIRSDLLPIYITNKLCAFLLGQGHILIVVTSKYFEFEIH